jgi:8-oxo-dGTP diphosphatase
MTHHRRRGAAIVETNKGILVTAGRSKFFITPGGGAKRSESRFQAAIRELKEETGLEPYFAMILFRFSVRHKTFEDHNTVCYIKAHGTPRPRKEVKYVAYYNPKSNIKLSSSTKEIIKRYYKFKEKHLALFDKLKKL